MATINVLNTATAWGRSPQTSWSAATSVPLGGTDDPANRVTFPTMSGGQGTNGCKMTGASPDASVRVNIGGTERLGQPYVNIGGTARLGVAYINIGGTQKQGV